MLILVVQVVEFKYRCRDMTCFVNPTKGPITGHADLCGFGRMWCYFRHVDCLYR